MNLSNTRATVGLSSKATPVSTNVLGTVQVGDNSETILIAGVDVAYSLQAFFAGSGDVLSLNMLTGSTAGSTAFVAGVAQVETATAANSAGTITTAGNITVTVTAAGMAGSPLALSVAVLTGDTASQWATKVRTALAANAVIAALFAVSGTTTAIILTRRPTNVLVSAGTTTNIFAANDTTLNIALATGTAVGVTAAATSANTTSGVLSDGVLIFDGDSKDFEGVTIPTLTAIKGQLFKAIGAPFVVDGNVDDLFTIAADSSNLFTPGLAETTYTFTPTGASALQITVVGND